SAPAIHVIQPAAGALLNTASTPVQLQYGDTQSVNTASLQVTLDGVDKTSLFTVTATGATATFTGLAEGPHTIAAQIADPTGNIGHTTSSLVVDTIRPQLTIVSPSGAVNTGSPIGLAQYSDAGSGINPASVHVFVDGSDVTSAFSVGSTSV